MELRLENKSRKILIKLILLKNCAADPLIINQQMINQSRQKRAYSLNTNNFGKQEKQEDNNTSSILENTPVSQFNKLRNLIYNFFQIAKSQLSRIYQFVLNQLYSIGNKLGHKGDTTQHLMEHITKLKASTEMAMVQFPSKLLNILVIPKIIKFNLKSSFQEAIKKQNLLKVQNKRKLTYNSVNNIQIEVNDLNYNRNQVKKITNTNFKNIENLQFLQAKWPSLQVIDLQAKAITSLCRFQQVVAKNLQIINLSNNQIADLKGLRRCHYPCLSQMILRKNKLKTIEGLQQSKLPQLKILNLSDNLISKVYTLKKCIFPELLELNLQMNRLSNVQPLNSTEFFNLQILNLDNNRFQNLDSLRDSPFSKLKVLSFSQNKISSMEFLDRMSLRRLEALIGHNNKIKSLEVLSNKQLPMLNQIVLYNNQISDIHCVSSMNFPVLTGFDLENNNIQPKTIGCFFISDKGYKQALKRYPFLII